MRIVLLLGILALLSPFSGKVMENDQFVDYLKPLYVSLHVGMEYGEALKEVEKAKTIARVTVTPYSYQDFMIVLWKGEDIFGDGRPEVWIGIHFSRARLVTCIIYVYSVNGVVREKYVKEEGGEEKCEDYIRYVSSFG